MSLTMPIFLLREAANDKLSCGGRALREDQGNQHRGRRLLQRLVRSDQHFGDLRFLPIALRASNFLI